MSKYQLPDGNIILADADFVAAHHPGAVKILDSQQNQRILEIKTRLTEIDTLGDSQRARREALLGNTIWLASLDAEATTLRAELAVL